VLDELSEPNVAFIPYWDWPVVNEPLNGRDVYASAYKGSDRMVLVLANLTADEQDVAISTEDLPMRGRIEDHMHGQAVRIEDGKLQCTIAPKNFRLLTIISEQDQP
jgi:hypothetical protein